MLHASGAASTLQRRGIPHTRPSCGCASVPPDPTQLLQKAHSCDRHHIASAMAELIFCMSIIPHVRSFDVPPKLSPAQRGAFFAPLELKGGTRSALLRRRRDRRADDSRRLGLPASLDDLDRSGELLVELRLLGLALRMEDARPFPVLRRRHQKRPRRFVDQCFAPWGPARGTAAPHHLAFAPAGLARLPWLSILVSRTNRRECKWPKPSLRRSTV
jgi:hypothetical protein